MSKKQENPPGTYYVPPVAKQGQALFELLIALAIAVLIVTSVVVVVTISVRNATFAKNKAEATRLGQQAMEWVREQRDTENWDTFLTHSNTTYCVGPITATTVWEDFVTTACSSTVISGTTVAFKRDVSISAATDTTGDGQDDTVEVTVTLEWQQGSRTHTSSVSTHLTKWR